MATIYDVDASDLIEKIVEELKKDENISPPDWAGFVKTGMSKDRVPANKDWWYVRAAAIFRTIYKYGPIGVSKLRVKYGGKKNRGNKPSRFYPGSGNIIRKVLQQLEKSEYLKKDDKSGHKGRNLTSKGRSFLDKLSTKICKEKGTLTKAKSKPEKETKKQEKPVVEKKQETNKDKPKENTEEKK
jgi:small subunit ribosomal protein S19e